MKKVIATLAGSAALAIAPAAFSQVFGDFEGFAEGTEVMFQEPRFSGSTANRLELTPNSTLVTATFPAGNALAGAQVLHTTFSVLSEVAAPWVRLTTFSTPNLPNPTIDFTQFLQFDIYSDRSFSIALGVRETGTTADIGANGGSANGIEFVGVTGVSGGAPIPTRTVEANTWTTLIFDVNGEPTVGFAGATANGTVEGTKGVLEHLALVPLSGESGAYNIFFDNFQVTPVPEPHEYAMFAGLALMGFAAYRRFRVQQTA